MKVSKSLLQAIAVAVVVGATAHSCTKEKEGINPENTNLTKKTPEYNCPACGMG
jgi:hypothetical protein